MDKAGGGKALPAQKQSAMGAAIFLLSASDTFNMFAEIEYLISGAQKPDGETPSINRAKEMCDASLGKLGKALNEFKDLTTEYAGSIKLINEALDKKMEDSPFLHQMFQEAHIVMESPITQRVISAYKNKKTEGVIEIVTEQIGAVLDAMKDLYKELGSNQIPKDTTLWKASSKWNQAVYTGRAIAAFFKVRQ